MWEWRNILSHHLSPIQLMTASDWKGGKIGLEDKNVHDRNVQICNSALICLHIHVCVCDIKTTKRNTSEFIDH
jgi:hypothetical protein